MTLKKFLDMNTNIDLDYIINFNWKWYCNSSIHSDETGEYTKSIEYAMIEDIEDKYLNSTVLDFFIRDDMTLCVGIDYYE